MSKWLWTSKWTVTPRLFSFCFHAVLPAIATLLSFSATTKALIFDPTSVQKLYTFLAAGYFFFQLFKACAATECKSSLSPSVECKWSYYPTFRCLNMSETGDQDIFRDIGCFTRLSHVFWAYLGLSHEFWRCTYSMNSYWAYLEIRLGLKNITMLIRM
jgi:hypothetical protein